jgi:hypothetical protein
MRKLQQAGHVARIEETKEYITKFERETSWPIAVRNEVTGKC